MRLADAGDKGGGWPAGGECLRVEHPEDPDAGRGSYDDAVGAEINA